MQPITLANDAYYSMLQQMKLLLSSAAAAAAAAAKARHGVQLKRTIAA
jgi:hypothetical protein